MFDNETSYGFAVVWESRFFIMAEEGTCCPYFCYETLIVLSSGWGIPREGSRVGFPNFDQICRCGSFSLELTVARLVGANSLQITI